MRSRFRTRRPADCVGLAAIVIALAACAGPSDPGSHDVVTAPAPDRIVAGPQGSVGQFVVECRFDRFRADDPIVRPGAAGASHLHQFFGAVGVSADSSQFDLVAGTTTCDQQADTASYWAPSLISADGLPIEPMMSTAYYRAGPDVEPTLVVPFPPGLMLVAGDHGATAPQPLSVVGWSCDVGSLRSGLPPDCTDARRLRMIVTFQDCWDGINIRSPILSDPDVHVSYSEAGECPGRHPVHIPQLQFAVDFEPVAPDGLSLSSGDILSGHADFWNTWDQSKLANEVVRCIHRNLSCGISG